MKSVYKFLLVLVVFLNTMQQYGQHHSTITAKLNIVNKTLHVQQTLTLYNQTTDTLQSIVLNDWNNAYSGKNTPLAKRFSDEFYRGFHLAKEDERGSTKNLTILDPNNLALNFERNNSTPDLVTVKLDKPLYPNQKVVLQLTYEAKIPNDKFTKYGYNDRGQILLKNWYLTPARYENNQFSSYSNFNLDDISNAVSDFTISLKVPKNLVATTDLQSSTPTIEGEFTNYNFAGDNRTDFNLVIELATSFTAYRNNSAEVLCNLKDNNLTEIQKAIIIDRVTRYVEQQIGKYPHEKILVTQTDYERNPFYGLNQLPSFLSPFSDEFIYEIKFLKTYLNAYLKGSLRLNQRNENWIYDAIQVYTMMKYIDKNHPDTKMLGSLSKFRILKSYNITKVNFNEQYSYLYMLMARKNLDQALGEPKNNLIKFNEQIAGKYRAGLSLLYLDDYLNSEVVKNSIIEFFNQNIQEQSSSEAFEKILKTRTSKDIDWFFNTIIDTRAIVDYKFTAVHKTQDSISFNVKSKTGALVPIPVYGLKKGNVIFKRWLDVGDIDSSMTLARNGVDKIVLNYKNEVPEFNLRNNWKSLKPYYPNNRPFKFNFLKDLEDPYYNQILYLPSLSYNLYDGLLPGLRLHNKTILEKPFIFDINPSFSTTTKSFSGSGFVALNQNYREGNLYNVRYSLSGSYFHYAPDAYYQKINPMVQLRIRESDLRDNKKQLFLFRQVLVHREKSALISDNAAMNYSVFDAKYFNSKTEVTNHFSYTTDLQVAGKFGKVSAEVEYRKLFENNLQVNLRFFAGSFLYNKTDSDFFSFALDRPTDYLFDYGYYGRSESSGFFSQQYIISEGGFKSKLASPYSNQWMTTVNGSFNVWNWVEIYGDVGLIKSKNTNTQFVYDSGFRLNLVTDYFELYFPVYSNNGWEITQKNYDEKIRFLVTFSPKTLINLFNRKWF